MFSKIVLIFERVGDGCYHSYLFNIRSVGITVVDRELTLVSLCDFVELAVAICCKLLSSSLGILYRFLHHLWFHLSEAHIFVGDTVLVSSIQHSHTLLEQFSLLSHDATHKLHFLRGYGYGRCDVVAETTVVVAVLVGIEVDDNRSVDIYLVVLDAMLLLTT